MAKTPLTTPIPLGRIATDWELLESDFDFDAAVVALTVQLVDADGATIQTTRVAEAFAVLGITVGDATSLRNKIVNRLRARGLIN